MQKCQLRGAAEVPSGDRPGDDRYGGYGDLDEDWFMWWRVD